MKNIIGASFYYDPTPPAYFYVLIEPDTQHVRYVGWTHDPQRRINQHVDFVRKTPWRKTVKSEWILEMTSRGVYPEMRIVDVLTDATRIQILAHERSLIAKHRAEGCQLINDLTDQSMREQALSRRRSDTVAGPSTYCG
jgi:predicted GIY-YIG superfamily endonuclease